MSDFTLEKNVAGEVMKMRDPTQLYLFFDRLFADLANALNEKIHGDLIPARAEFIMNRPLYRQFLKAWPAILPPEWNGIHISELCDESYTMNGFGEPVGKIILTYDIPQGVYFEFTERNRDKIMPPKGECGFSIKECFFSIPSNLKIKKVIINDPATIVMWNDGTKTVVKCQEGDTFDPEKGLAMCVVKKMYGLKDFYKSLNPAFNNWISDLDVEENIWDRIRKITS